MPYVKRDPDGTIIAVHNEPQNGATEEVSVDDPELRDYVLEAEREEDLKEVLVASDAEMARVTEDLIELLIEKNIIMFTDLPEAARSKLLLRRKVRNRMGSLVGLVDDDDVI